MANIIIAPGKYIQGQGELDRIGAHIRPLGQRAFVLIGRSGYERMGERLEAGFRAGGCEVHFECFDGECSRTEIERMKAAMARLEADVVVGVGGGKILDTAKALAYYGGKPVAVVPTSASTDAPCSSLSVLYHDDGVFDRYLQLPSNPNIVLVDTDVVSKAPVRLLVSGMGDALSTWFEARAAADARAVSNAGGQATNAALVLARARYDTLLADGLKAKLAVERRVCTRAVENIIEANIYLSGLGFESGGLAAAHAIHNGLTVALETRGMYHGEKVAFGTLAQLVLQNAPMDQIEEVLGFCNSVGLPTTLAGLGLADADMETIRAVAEAACVPGGCIYNMPMEITADKVCAAILTADALGRQYK